MKYTVCLLFLFILLFSLPVQAQSTAKKDAIYLATVKAVADFKINDAETFDDVEKLRENKRFLKDLQNMVNKLSNDKNKDAKNRKVLKILQQAGEDIYNILN